MLAVDIPVKEGVSAPKTLYEARAELGSARAELGSAHTEIKRLQRQIFESATVQRKLTDDLQSSASGRVSLPEPDLDPDWSPSRLRSVLGSMTTSGLRTLLGIEGETRQLDGSLGRIPQSCNAGFQV